MSYRKWLLVATIIFGIGILAGLVAPPDLLSQDIADLEDIADLLAELSQPAIFIFILVRNALALLLSFALGPIFCLVPLIALIMNGWLLAAVSSIVIQQQSLALVLAGLVPHGVFELPAFLLAQAAALSFGTTAIVALFRKERRGLLWPSLKQNTRYLMIALVLLVPAAAIETFITPLLMGWFD